MRNVCRKCMLSFLNFIVVRLRVLVEVTTEIVNVLKPIYTTSYCCGGTLYEPLVGDIHIEVLNDDYLLQDCGPLTDVSIETLYNTSCSGSRSCRLTRDSITFLPSWGKNLKYIVETTMNVRNCEVLLEKVHTLNSNRIIVDPHLRSGARSGDSGIFRSHSYRKRTCNSTCFASLQSRKNSCKTWKFCVW